MERVCKMDGCDNIELLPNRRICKECQKVYTRNYYQQNKETIKQQSQVYSETHKEEKAEYYRRYYIAKRDQATQT